VSSGSEIGSGVPGFEWSSGQETLRVEPWGPDGIRVRGRVGPILGGLPGALAVEPDRYR
jgi:alpha-D-xyloside xylohydrolase